jgi:hypothetical protein
VSLQRLTQGGGLCCPRTWLRDDYKIDSIQLVLHAAKTFPDTTLNPVTNYCLCRHPARNRYTKTRMPKIVAAGMHAEKAVAYASPGSADFTQLCT